MKDSTKIKLVYEQLRRLLSTSNKKEAFHDEQELKKQQLKDKFEMRMTRANRFAEL